MCSINFQRNLLFNVYILFGVSESVSEWVNEWEAHFFLFYTLANEVIVYRQVLSSEHGLSSVECVCRVCLLSDFFLLFFDCRRQQWPCPWYSMWTQNCQRLTFSSLIESFGIIQGHAEYWQWHTYYIRYRLLAYAHEYDSIVRFFLIPHVNVRWSVNKTFFFFFIIRSDVCSGCMFTCEYFAGINTSTFERAHNNQHL